MEFEAQVKEINNSIKEVGDQIKAHAEKVNKDLANGRAVTEETRASVDKLLNDHGALQARLQAAEQMIARAERGEDVGPESLGDKFVAQEGFESFARSAQTQKMSMSMDINAAITSVTTNTDGAAGDLVSPNRLPGVIEPPQRRLTMRDLISPGRTNSPLVEYVKRTGFTNNAATVAEGALKPESTMKFDKVSTTTKVIAHWMPASRQILSDAPQLASMIDNILRYGLALEEDDQILNGDGTGENLLGIIPQASAYAPAFAPSSETVIDKVRLAMLQAFLAEYPATGIVLNPVDWARVETIKDADGRYIIGNPQDGATPRLWRLPVVETQSIGVDKFLVGAFKLGAQLFDQWDARVEVSTEDRDNFVKNMVTVLAEERLALAVYRPESFVYGDLGYEA